MTQQVTLGGTDVTAKLGYAGITVKLNTCDFVLVDPLGPASFYLGHGSAVVVKDPGWSGTVSGVVIADLVDLASGHFSVTITATNTNPAGSSVSPFGLSDAPAAAADSLLLLENGTDILALEDASAWAPGDYAIEAAGDTYGYQGLSLKSTWDGTTELRSGRVTCFQPGLWPGMVFPLTSANLGLAAVAYVVLQMTVTWPAGQPVFVIEFGTAGSLYTFTNWKHGA